MTYGTPPSPPLVEWYTLYGEVVFVPYSDYSTTVLPTTDATKITCFLAHRDTYEAHYFIEFPHIYKKLHLIRGHNISISLPEGHLLETETFFPPL